MSRGHDTTGEVVDEIELPPRADTRGMLPTGELVVEAGGMVFLVGEDETTTLAQARVLGVAGSVLLLHVCEAELECAIELVDLARQTSFEIETLRDTAGFPQLVREDVIVVFDSSQDVQVYRVEGEDAVLDDTISQQQANFLLAGFADAEATDTTGLSAIIDGDDLLFVGLAGEVLTSVSLDFLPGFGDSYALAFVTIDG